MIAILRFLFPVIFLFQAGRCCAQQGSSFSTIEGLSHNKAKCILQDRMGFMWFGTDYGLNRFNGYEFEVFKNIPGDPASLSHNNVFSLLQDRDGIIWIGTFRNLCSYDPKTEKFTQYTSPLGIIHDIKEDKDGLLWIASSTGLFSYNKKTRRNIQYSFGKGLYVRSLFYEKNKHVLWLATFNNGIKRFDIGSMHSTTYHLPGFLPGNPPDELLGNLLIDRQGHLWITTFARGIYNLDLVSKTFAEYKHQPSDPSSLPGNVTSQMLEDTDGKIWIANEDNGLTIFDPLTKKFTNVSAGWKFKMQNHVLAIFKDDHANYWLGTTGGIVQFDTRAKPFQSLEQKDYPLFQPALTMLEDDRNNIWIGNYGGLFLLDIDAGTCDAYSDIIGLGNDRRIFSSIKNNGEIWLGSSGCIYSLKITSPKDYNKASLKKITLPITRRAGVMSLLKGQGNDLWIGTQGAGLLRYDMAADTFTTFQAGINEPDIKSIWQMLQISPDSLLIGTDGHGLVLLTISNRKIEKIKFKLNGKETSGDYSIVKDIHAGTNGDIWIATAGSGLWQTNKDLQSFRNFNLKDGLQSINLEQVEEDGSGQLWLRNNLGLDIMNKQTGLVINYSQKEGLLPGEQDYLLKTSNGNFLLRDAAALHIFSSSGLRRNKVPPRVYVTGIQVMDQAVQVPADNVLRLPYDQNYISFGFVGLSYLQPHKNTYAYKMEGLEGNWTNSKDRRYVSYANLKEGKYVFKVKAANNDGFWNDQPAAITIIIHPPFWRTWWFYSLAFLATLAVAYFLYRARLKKLEAEYALRNQISKDLHDDVGSALSSINALSNLALQHLPPDVENSNAKTTLGKIQRSSNEMLDAMNDIVWSIQPQNDYLENIIPRMVAFASEVLEAKRITLTCNIPGNLDGLRLGLKSSHDFFMIFKESINNLAKYSEAKQASITIEWQRPMLVLVIADDGKGFDNNNHRKGNGLKNMRSRAENMNATVDIRSAPGTGTVIRLALRLT